MRQYKVTGSTIIDAENEAQARARVMDYLGLDVEVTSIEDVGEARASTFWYVTSTEGEAIDALLANLRGATVEVPSEVLADL